MNSTEGYQALAGWSSGAYHSFLNRTEVHSLRNKNNFFAAFCQYQQLMQVVSLACAVAPVILSERDHRPLRIAVKALQYVSIPLLAMSALINSGEYRRAAIALNRRLPVSIPTKLHLTVEKVCDFMARQGTNLLRIAMLVTLMVYYQLGSRLYALGFASAILFHVLANSNVISAKISSAIHHILTAMTVGPILYQGSMANRIICVMQLPTLFSSIMSKNIYAQTDSFLRRQWPAKLRGYSLETLERPWEDRKTMTLTEMEELLNGATLNLQLTLNPAHLTKSVVGVSPHLKRSEDYQQLMTMWDQHNWRPRVPFLLDKLLQDELFADQFIEDMLCNREHVEAGRSTRLTEGLRSHFIWIGSGNPPPAQQQREHSLMQWVQGNMPEAHVLSDLHLPSSSSTLQDVPRPSLQQVEDYVIQKVREMLADFIGTLNLTNADSQSLTENVSVLIPYFERDLLCFQDDNSNDLARRNFEERFLKLVISRAALSDSEKVLQLYFENLIVDEAFNTVEHRFEFRLKQALYEKRKTMVERMLESHSQGLQIERFMEHISRRIFSRGFIPQPDFSSKSLGFESMLHWEIVEPFRIDLYREYRQSLCTLATFKGEEYLNYVREIIDSQAEQKEGQRAALLQRFNTAFQNPNSIDNSKFKVLILYRLGLIKLFMDP